MEERLTRRDGPAAMSILTGTTIIGFIVLAIGIGWVKSDIGELRTELQSEAGQLRTEIAANRDRIDAVGERLSTFETSVSERLTRIETLLEERLPARR